MFDSHMHTKFSTDSKMYIDDAVKYAKKLNLGIIITEHIDLNFPVEGKFIFDIPEYFKAYEKYRNKNLLLGVELGMREDCIEENKKIQNDYKFDYVIGSVHLVDNIDIYEEVFYKGRSKKEVYEQYFDTMLKCVESYDFVDSIGHIDYISRYARYEDKEIYYDEYKYLIDEVLKKIVKKDKALEINTRRLDNKKSVQELIKIYKRFYELGGRYVTVGSDAHIQNNIGMNFKNARYITDICNLNIIHFEDRKPVLDKQIA